MHRNEKNQMAKSLPPFSSTCSDLRVITTCTCNISSILRGGIILHTFAHFFVKKSSGFMAPRKRMASTPAEKSDRQQQSQPLISRYSSTPSETSPNGARHSVVNSHQEQAFLARERHDFFNLFALVGWQVGRVSAHLSNSSNPLSPSILFSSFILTVIYYRSYDG
jgi:hypothetical protein